MLGEVIREVCGITTARGSEKPVRIPPTPHPTSSFWISPQGNFPRALFWISLGLVDLSRTPIGTFFWEVHPGSEMASQNDQNKAK